MLAVAIALVRRWNVKVVDLARFQLIFAVNGAFYDLSVLAVRAVVMVDYLYLLLLTLVLTFRCRNARL
jgi:hypothetical protein